MSIEGILGYKIGMSQMFDEESGDAIPVTVIETPPCTVVQVKTSDIDGYEAVQVGFGTRKAKHITKPLKGHFKGNGDFRHLREMKVEDVSAWEVGQKVGCEIFEPGEFVDVSGPTKGRGFAGVIKRHGFHGGPKTHGQSDRWRAPGSIGAGTSPGRVIKGKKMAGHMGTGQGTAKTLKVIKADTDKGILFVRGPVPGSRGTLLKIRKTSRKKSK
jgi:large subunit ribosomal protein L3